MPSTFDSLRGNTNVCTVRLNEEVALNIGEGEQLVGIEMLDAKEVLGAGKVPAVILEGLESASAPLLLHDKPAKKYGK